MIRAFLILSNAYTRGGVRECLARQGDFHIAGEAAEFDRGWSELARQRVDLLILDGAAMRALHASGRLQAETAKPAIPTLVLFTTGEEMAEMDRELQARVRGFIDAQTPPDALLAALRKIAAGERHVSPALLPRMRGDSSAPASAGTPEELLSSRELEVFELTASGLESKEIGDQLNISPRTVDVHRANIRQKLGLSGVHELMRYALTWRQNRERVTRLGRFCSENRPLLIVEDDEVDILSAQRALQRLSARFRVEAARNGEEALAWLKKTDHAAPFLILLDINMPRMNGHEFISELRKDPALSALPVVVMTTSRHDGDRERLFRMGIMGYLLKPNTSAEYLELFRSLAEYWGFNSPPPAPTAPKRGAASHETAHAA